MEAQVSYSWDLAWKAFDNGQQYRFFAVQCDADIVRWRSNVTTLTPAQLQDFDKAERLHRSHVEQLGFAQAQLEHYRNEMKNARDQMSGEVSKVNFYAFQTLGLANGAVVIATLGYIGQSAIRPVPHGLIWVIGLAAAGFFLNLLSAHIATLLISKPIAIATQQMALFLSFAKRQQLEAKFPRALKVALWPPRILSYFSAVCLFLAFIIGAFTLLHLSAEPPVAAPAAKEFKI